MTNVTKFAVSVAVAAVAIAVLFSPLSLLLSHAAWSVVAIVLVVMIVVAGLLAIEAATGGMDARRKAKEREVA